MPVYEFTDKQKDNLRKMLDWVDQDNNKQYVYPETYAAARIMLSTNLKTYNEDMKRIMNRVRFAYMKYLE